MEGTLFYGEFERKARFCFIKRLFIGEFYRYLKESSGNGHLSL
jgi:hypothetical protein